MSMVLVVGVLFLVKHANATAAALEIIREDAFAYDLGPEVRCQIQSKERELSVLNDPLNGDRSYYDNIRWTKSVPNWSELKKLVALSAKVQLKPLHKLGDYAYGENIYINKILTSGKTLKRSKYLELKRADFTKRALLTRQSPETRKIFEFIRVNCKF